MEAIEDIDRDSIYILPLAMIPLETPWLKRTRMFKNSHLESVVEIFKGKLTGSGQVKIDGLVKTFGSLTLEDDAILHKLAELPSYDVYSLRIFLRKQGIPVNDDRYLQLSPHKKLALANYMKQFTRPLVLEVFGEDTEIESDIDVAALFRDPDSRKVREKLRRLADKLGISVEEVPEFLEDYGDIFLSIAYYDDCLKLIEPIFDEFQRTAVEMSNHPVLRNDKALMKTCASLQSSFKDLKGLVMVCLKDFSRASEDLWMDINGERFRSFKTKIESKHTTVAGILCGLTVKMNAWSTEFSTRQASSLQKRADFIRMHMPQGVETIGPIK